MPTLESLAGAGRPYATNAQAYIMSNELVEHGTFETKYEKVIFGTMLMFDGLYGVIAKVIRQNDTQLSTDCLSLRQDSDYRPYDYANYSSYKYFNDVTTAPLVTKTHWKENKVEIKGRFPSRIKVHFTARESILRLAKKKAISDLKLLSDREISEIRDKVQQANVIPAERILHTSDGYINTVARCSDSTDIFWSKCKLELFADSDALWINYTPDPDLITRKAVRLAGLIKNRDNILSEHTVSLLSEYGNIVINDSKSKVSVFTSDINLIDTKETKREAPYINQPKDMQWYVFSQLIWPALMPSRKLVAAAVSQRGRYSESTWYVISAYKNGTLITSQLDFFTNRALRNCIKGCHSNILIEALSVNALKFIPEYESKKSSLIQELTISDTLRSL